MGHGVTAGGEAGERVRASGVSGGAGFAWVEEVVVIGVEEDDDVGERRFAGVACAVAVEVVEEGSGDGTGGRWDDRLIGRYCCARAAGVVGGLGVVGVRAGGEAVGGGEGGPAVGGA